MRVSSFITIVAIVAIFAQLSAAQPKPEAPPTPAPATPGPDVDAGPPKASLRIYDVRDLLVDIPDHPMGPRIVPPTELGNGPTFGGSGNGPSRAEPRKESFPQERVDTLIKSIEDLIMSDTWRDAGGSVGSIREFNGQLVVTQTADAHAALGRLLELLRSSSRGRVTVRADWVLLAPDELDRCTHALDADRQGAKPDASLRVVDFSQFEKLGGKPQRVHAEITCIDRQIVHIASGPARNTVSDLEPVVGNGSISFSPTVSYLQSGATLVVRPILMPRGALVDIESVVSDAGDAEVTRKIPSAASSQPTLRHPVERIDRVNMLIHHFSTTALLPLGKPVIVGGMTLEPGAKENKHADGRELYLILQVDAAAGKP